MRTAALGGIPSLKKRNPVNGAFRRMAGLSSHFRALCVLLVLGGLTSGALAEVDYVRDISIPDYPEAPQFNLATSQSPFDSGGTNVLPYLTRPYEYAVLDVSEGEFFLPPPPWPYDLKLNIFSKLTWVGQSSTGPNLVAINGQKIFTYNATGDITTSGHWLSGANYTTPQSVAALSMDAPISFLTDTTHYTVDYLTGVMTERPLVGADTATTQFMSYGADGLLYVLDYGNSRIASFDPDNLLTPFAPIGSFTLETGVTTANQQFAIGINGNFYLADGLGGGSSYSKTGAFLGTFALPENAATAPYTGQSFINTDAAGNIFVYDALTGLHQYHDASVVPEPSTTALVLCTLLGALFLRHHRA